MSDGGSEGGRENVECSADPLDQLKKLDKPNIMYVNFFFKIVFFVHSRTDNRRGDSMHVRVASESVSFGVRQLGSVKIHSGQISFAFWRVRFE